MSLHLNSRAMTEAQKAYWENFGGNPLQVEFTNRALRFAVDAYLKSSGLSQQEKRDA